MKAFIEKLKSRKFLTCIAGVIMGACMYFGLDVSAVDKISGALLTVLSVVTYIYTEGKIDAAAVDKIKDAIDDVEEAVDTVNTIEE